MPTSAAVARLKASWACGISCATGITLQLAQREDPRFAFVYFTVDSIAFLGIVLLIGIVSPRIEAGRTWQALVEAAVTATVLSGLIYWAAIAPVKGLGTTAPTVMANIVLHGCTPVLAIMVATTGTFRHRGRGLLFTVTWPVAYGVVVLIAAVFGFDVPYTFLDPDEIGWPAVLLVGACLVTLSIAVHESVAYASAFASRRSPPGTSGANDTSP